MSERRVTCSDCGEEFLWRGTRGHPPLRCDDCRESHLAAYRRAYYQDYYAVASTPPHPSEREAHVALRPRRCDGCSGPVLLDLDGAVLDDDGTTRHGCGR